MTTLARYCSSKLVGFFSYSREDDADFDDVLSKFRIAIQAELSAQLGRNRDNFRIWQDKIAIPHGALWKQQIADGIKQSTFYIPIITPRVVNSPHCAFEFTSFLAREKELGRDDLVFPILYISVPELEDRTWQDNPVLKIVQERQYLDWRDYRPRELSEPEVRTKLIQFCQNISNALRKSWESPEEREQRHMAEAEHAATKEDRSAATQIEAEEKVVGPRAKTLRFAEEEVHSNVRSPEREPLLAVASQQDKRGTAFGSPLGIAQLPKSKAPRTVMMIAGLLAAVILIGASAWTLNRSAPQGRSEWVVGRSRVYLEPTGGKRQFYFVEPSAELASEGAQPNALLFDGRKVNETYEGKLFVFAGRCGTRGYDASGPITNDDDTVTLTGIAPQIDPENCEQIGEQEKTLVFNLKRPPN